MHAVSWKSLALGALLVLGVAGEGRAERTWSYTYTPEGLVASADGPRTDVADRTTYAYDAQGNRIRITNALGQVTEIPAYDAAGRPLRIVDPNGVETVLGYDLRGRLVSRTVAGALTRFTYDPVGNFIGITAPDGVTLSFEYDAARRLTAVSDAAGNRIEYTLDAAGNRTAEVIKDAAGALAYQRSRVFDELSHLIRDIDAETHTRALGYDPNGNRTSEIDPKGHAHTQAFDALDRLVAHTDPLGGQTQLAYDGADRLTRVVDPRGNPTGYSYDGLGNLTAIDSPDTGRTTFTHDAAGNVLSRTDANGVVTLYAYDALNRLTAASYPAAPAHAVSYLSDTAPGCSFGIGRLCRIADASGSIDYAYDAQGRVVREIRTTARVSLVSEYAYDGAGRLTGITLPSGRVVSYGRGIDGRVSSVSATLDGLGQTLASDIAYQPFGPLRGLVLGNGLTTTRSYDLDYQLRDVTMPTPGAGMAAWAFSHDPNGNLTNMALEAYTKNFRYDPLDRLVEEQKLASASSTQRSFAYDPIGNRTAETVDGATETYLYPVDSSRLQQKGTQVYSHDAAGNVIDDGRFSYQHTPENRIARVYEGATLIASYTYNAFGQRVKKETAAGITLYVYDPNGSLIGEYAADGTPIREYVHLEGEPLAQIDVTATAERITYLHTDHLATPRRGTDASGTVVWSWESEAFGATRADEDPDGDGQSLTVNLRLPGQYFDVETGLHYNYFRDYNPSTGRYIQSDPIGLEGGLNTYLYANANPIRYTDPTGQNPATGATWGGNIGTGIGASLVGPVGAAIGRAVGAGVGAGIGYGIAKMCEDEDDLEKRCEEQLDRDMEMCDAIARAERRGNRRRGAAARCRSTAMERYGNCLAGRDRGPLDTWNN